MKKLEKILENREKKMYSFMEGKTLEEQKYILDRENKELDSKINGIKFDDSLSIDFISNSSLDDLSIYKKRKLIKFKLLGTLPFIALAFFGITALKINSSFSLVSFLIAEASTVALAYNTFRFKKNTNEIKEVKYIECLERKSQNNKNLEIVDKKIEEEKKKEEVENRKREEEIEVSRQVIAPIKRDEENFDEFRKVMCKKMNIKCN